MTITCNEGFQSYQLHPDDAYALAHEGCRGKVSGAVTLDDEGHVGTWLFGHKVASLEEFKDCVERRDWNRLFDTLKVHDGDFVHTPAGVIHGGNGAGAVSATFGRTATSRIGSSTMTATIPLARSPLMTSMPACTFRRFRFARSHRIRCRYRA